MYILTQFQIFEHEFCLDERVVAEGGEVEVCEWMAGKEVGADHLDERFDSETVSKHGCEGGEEGQGYG